MEMMLKRYGMEIMLNDERDKHGHRMVTMTTRKNIIYR